ncbi:MAG: hypothetical protein OXH83_17820 [Bryobacterales bacterium]|nr:hypothetical protein [Bryobacterales bacterium]
MPRTPDTAESEFRFEPVAGPLYPLDPGGPDARWGVSCEGVDWAILTFHAPGAEWRLSGLGPLQGVAAAWGHDGSAVRRVPAGIRRDAVAALAMTGLARLKRNHETLARIRESLGAARAAAEASLDLTSDLIAFVHDVKSWAEARERRRGEDWTLEELVGLEKIGRQSKDLGRRIREAMEL